MGKRATSILKSSNSNLVTYPYLLPKGKADSAGYRGVNIRVTNKSNITIDFECYDNKGQRIKAKGLANGKIPAGDYSDEKTNEFNKCIHNIQGKVLTYIDNNSHVTKELLSKEVYGADFFETHKRKRTEYITIPIHDRGRIIDSIDLDRTEIKELMEDYFVKNRETGKTESVTDVDTGEFVIQSEEDFNEILVDAKSTKDNAAKRKAEQERITKLSTEERYKKGHFDKTDIFQVFAMTYFDDKNEITNDFYPKIVIRLFEYKERAKPSSNVKDYNLQWVTDFFKWFDENGYYSINTKNFDPLKYNSDIFKRKRERKQYTGKSLQKMLNIMKDLSRKFAKRGLLPRVENLDELKLKTFSKKKDRSGTRKEYALTKDEFDTLYHHKVLAKDLKKYQSIFNSVNNSKTIDVTVDQLRDAKDMFICQTMFGGLRGWHDYKTVEIRKHSKDIFKACFKVGKKDDAIENPLNDYTRTILSGRKNKLPFIDSEQLYRSLIKTVVRFLSDELDRDVKPNKFENKYVKVSELFQSGWFARKTFSQILRKVGIEKEGIELFTGHENDNGELSVSYLDDNTIENKIELIKNLKIGEGLS